MNLIASEKETWRRHRRIMGPAFNPKTYSLVWSETLRVFKDMVSSEGWDTKDSVEIAVIQKYTFKLALYVISSVGFGLPFIWDAPPTNEDGSMPLQEAFKTFTDHPTLWLAAPKWLYKLPFKWCCQISLDYFFHVAYDHIIKDSRPACCAQRITELYDDTDQ